MGWAGEEGGGQKKSLKVPGRGRGKNQVNRRKGVTVTGLAPMKIRRPSRKKKRSCL